MHHRDIMQAVKLQRDMQHSEELANKAIAKAERDRRAFIATIKVIFRKHPEMAKESAWLRYHLINTAGVDYREIEDKCGIQVYTKAI